jgi:hypothetical protein
MANSVVELVNNALIHIGASLITSLDQPTKSAIVAKQIFPSVRDATLRAFTWNCATKQVILAPLATAPAFDWSYAFQLPSDCLRVVSLQEGVEYEVQNRQIFADSDVLYLTYVFRQEDVSQYDALLTSAMECRLASALAYSLLESANVRDSLFQLYNLMIREARGVDSREKSSQEWSADVWIQSRWNSGGGRFRNNR